MEKRLRGILPPMVTPFNGNETVDAKALRDDVQYLLDEAGAHGVTVGGSTGEGHTLTATELRQVAGTAVEAAAGKAPVIAGVIANSTRQAVERAQAVADLGVAALQLTPVHYLFNPTDDMHLKHFATIAAAADVPILIYNVVPHVYLSPQLLTRILRAVPGVIGVKQSAGDMKLLADLLLLAAPEDVVFSAVDALLYPSFCLGAQGAIAAILAAAPKTCVALWQAMQAGDHAAGLALHERLLPLWNALQGDNLPANVRAAMRRQGRAGGRPRAPMPEASPAQEAAIEKALRGLAATERA